MKTIFEIGTPEIDFKNEKLVSFSQFSTYMQCPKKWELKYIRKQKLPCDSIHLIFGTAIHVTIQNYLQLVFGKSIKKADEQDLPAMLMAEMKSEYKKALDNNGNKHFSNPQELSEFYGDGVEIIKSIKKYRKELFSTRDYRLIGIELPLYLSPIEKKNNVKLTSYLDLVFQHKKTGRYRIIDIKTSGNGWSKWEKEDKVKTSQLLIYKHYFAQKYNIAENVIDIEYLIVKRKINTDNLWPQKRIQKFSPSNGKPSINKAIKAFEDFINNCFDENGKYIDKDYPAIAGKNNYNCRFCEFNERYDLCPLEKRIKNV